MATPLHKNPYPGGHEIYNFDRSLLYSYFVWTVPWSREEDFLKKYINFILFTLKLSPLGWGQ